MRTLHLKGLSFSKSTLQHCISRHPKLQRLQIRNALLTDGTAWDASLMKDIANGPSMQKVKLAFLWQRIGLNWIDTPEYIPGEYCVRPGTSYWSVDNSKPESSGSNDRVPRIIKVKYEPHMEYFSPLKAYFPFLFLERDHGRVVRFQEQFGPLRIFLRPLQ